jgi:hypothetical protein
MPRGADTLLVVTWAADEVSITADGELVALRRDLLPDAPPPSWGPGAAPSREDVLAGRPSAADPVHEAACLLVATSLATLLADPPPSDASAAIAGFLHRLPPPTVMPTITVRLAELCREAGLPPPGA